MTENSEPLHYFLSVDVVHEIHSTAIEQFGGSTGLRDVALLESAVAAPQATFGGVYVYATTVEIAAAYLFFLCRNHPFVDGNKRVALGACLVFLRLSGAKPKADDQAWEDLTLDVASSKLNRESATERLQGLVDF